ncbi:MAG: UvrB/UvrC motif-containing protein [Flavobacteriales bacterium]|nr:UvrB/UvrC motif-containing protein [Flavobacteriales bacterium]
MMKDQKDLWLKNTVEPLLKELLDNAAFHSFPRTFAYPNRILRDSILFIGINPSNSKDDHNEIETYDLKQDENGHSYFKKFQEISAYCKTPWAHLDMLFFRETDQSRISELLKSDNGVKYVWEQLQVSGKLMERCNPEVIIVCNSLARTFLGFDSDGKTNIWLGFSFSFDNEIGTYRWNGIPVFFSSMLIGQRALDRGSYERLKWQVRNTLIIDLEKKKKEVVNLKNKVVRTQKYELAAELRGQERVLENRLSELRFNNEQ